jgi:hypothetical protein
MAMNSSSSTLADLVDLDDVGVGEAGEGLGLALEAGLADAEAGSWTLVRRSLRATRRSSSGS